MIVQQPDGVLRAWSEFFGVCANLSEIARRRDDERRAQLAEMQNTALRDLFRGYYNTAVEMSTVPTGTQNETPQGGDPREVS